MCEHNRIIGDNYGETCMDCGEILRGWGYRAMARRCEHERVRIGDDYYCAICNDLLVPGEDDEV